MDSRGVSKETLAGSVGVFATNTGGVNEEDGVVEVHGSGKGISR